MEESKLFLVGLNIQWRAAECLKVRSDSRRAWAGSCELDWVTRSAIIRSGERLGTALGDD